MLKSIRFENFKVLKDADLKLGQFNLVVGPNGSGKSTALQGLEGLAQPQKFQFQQLATTASGAENIALRVTLPIEGRQPTCGAVWRATVPGQYRVWEGRDDTQPQSHLAE